MGVEEVGIAFEAKGLDIYILALLLLIEPYGCPLGIGFNFRGEMDGSDLYHAQLRGTEQEQAIGKLFAEDEGTDDNEDEVC